jgi:hypothetical protein
VGGGGGRGVSLQWVSVGGYRCDKSRQSRTEAGAVGASRDVNGYPPPVYPRVKTLSGCGYGGIFP